MCYDRNRISLVVVFKNKKFYHLQCKDSCQLEKSRAELTAPLVCNKIPLCMSDICSHYQEVGHTMAKLLSKFQTTILVISQVFH